jgi:broad specificity phosphatase PhoE
MKNNTKQFILINGRSFLFIRHGQTSWGMDDILKGPQDLELNEIGCGQAKIIYEKINKDHIKNPVVYCSHLKRAHETATIFVSMFPKKLKL